jgi:hypothetical protein
LQKSVTGKPNIIIYITANSYKYSITFAFALSRSLSLSNSCFLISEMNPIEVQDSAPIVPSISTTTSTTTRREKNKQRKLDGKLTINQLFDLFAKCGLEVPYQIRDLQRIYGYINDRGNGINCVFCSHYSMLMELLFLIVLENSTSQTQLENINKYRELIYGLNGKIISLSIELNSVYSKIFGIDRTIRISGYEDLQTDLFDKWRRNRITKIERKINKCELFICIYRNRIQNLKRMLDNEHGVTAITRKNWYVALIEHYTKIDTFEYPHLLTFTK